MMETIQFSDYSHAYALEAPRVTVIIFESPEYLRDFARSKLSEDKSWEPLADGSHKYRAVFYGETSADCLALHARLLVEQPDLGLQQEPLML